MQPRDPARGDDARSSLGLYAPEDLPRCAVDAERLAGGADDEAIAAEERRAKVDSRYKRAPPRRVPQSLPAHGFGWGRASRFCECAVELGGRVDLDVFAADLAKRVARFAKLS